MKTAIFKKIFLITAVLLATWASRGQIPKPMKNTYVDDFAKVLTADQVTALNKQIFDIEKQSSVQFAVVLVSKIPDGFDIEDYSLLLARKWHVGKHKNGLVYVAAINQHKQRLEVAGGLDTTFTPDACQNILDAIKPSFKAGDYNAGLQTLVSQVQSTLAVTAQPPPVLPPPPAPIPQPSSGGGGGVIIVLFFVGIVLLVLAYRVRGNRVRSRNIVYNNGGYNNQPTGYYNGQPHHHSGVGTFIAGAAAGYAASTIVDDTRDSRNNNYSGDDGSTNSSSNDNNSDNTQSNWGNWGSGDDNSSNNDSSSDDSSSSSDSSSNDDSGFSGSDSSGNDSGATSNW